MRKRATSASTATWTPAPRGKRAVLVFRDDGWRIENQGSGSWLVNQTTVMPGRDCRLRSGDIRPHVGRRPGSTVQDRYGARLRDEHREQGAKPRNDAGGISGFCSGTGRGKRRACQVNRPPRMSDAAVCRPVVAAVLLVSLAFGLGFWADTDVAAGCGERSGRRETEPPGKAVNLEKDGGTGGDSSTRVEADSSPAADPAFLQQDKVSVSEPERDTGCRRDSSSGGRRDGLLMVEINEQKFPVCCGWAVAPDLVVSTGGPIAVLAEMLEKGQPVFAAYGDRSPRFVPVDALIVHPLFEKDQANLPVSRAHNVGVATLKAALPKHCDLERASALPKPPTGNVLTLWPTL
jgi:hypothetical protein